MSTADPREALAALIGRQGASYAALSRLIGRNAAYLQQFVTRGSPRRLAERDRRLLAAYFGVSEDLLGADPDGTAPPAVTVPRLDVAASAGGGALIDAEPRLGELGLDPRLVSRLGSRPADLSLIRAAGRSMEPQIADGDELLVDRGDRRVSARGAIFVIRLDDALMVKRVSRHAGGYRIVSDNPEFATIDAVDLDVIGRVVWLSRALR
jgi:phage repressor protein C with HTH and peptisase S24 domain